MSEPPDSDRSAPYAAIVRLVELELELAGEGRYTEMAQLGHQREQILAQLPSPAPPDARDLLTRALWLQRRVSIELMRRRESVLIGLRRVEVHRRAAHGYGRSLPDARAHRITANG